MNISLILLLFFCLTIPSVVIAKDIDQDVILPLERILQAAQKLHPGRVIEVDLEKKKHLYIYEIEIADNDGQVWELKFNASDATLLSQERDD